MRNTVMFKYSAEFVGAAESEDVLGVEGAKWFVQILGRIPALEVDLKLTQEDWGVVAVVRAGGKAFWLGLSPGEEDGEWTAHVHHGVGTLVQRFTASGKQARRELLAALERALIDAGATALRWFDEKDTGCRQGAAPSFESHPSNP